MAPIVTDRNYRQLLTDSVAKRSRKIQDIIFKATPLTRILKESGRVQTKAAGGPELRVPIEFDRLKSQWFTGYDFIDITPKELRNSAVFPWSRIVSMFSLTGTELLYNRGEEEIIDTLAATMSNAERSIKEDWEAALISDGTADGGRQMIGLGGAVPIVTNSGVYGGINRANVPNWRTTTYNIPAGDISGYTTWDVTTARPIISRAALNRSRGGQYPSLAIADSLAYEPILASLVAHQRITSERSARLGFESIGVWTPAGLVDVVAAGGIGTVMTPNTVFMLDTDNLSIYEFPGQSFVPFHPGDGIRPINQDAFAQGIVWSGQFVNENPLSQIRLVTA